MVLDEPQCQGYQNVMQDTQDSLCFKKDNM